MAGAITRISTCSSPVDMSCELVCQFAAAKDLVGNDQNPARSFGVSDPAA